MTTRRLRVGAELVYELEDQATFLFNLSAASTDRQDVTDEAFEIEPQVRSTVVHYGEDGPPLRRLRAEAGELRIVYRAEVALSVGGDPSAEAEHDLAELPGAVLPLLSPSRYCESDRVTALAYREFGSLQPGLARVQAITDWVGQEMAYVPGSTDASTTAVDALALRAGVCRDYAHVAIALCRAMGIPARYVSGYGEGVDPPDFHGFIEAYVGGRWHLLDPTGMSRPDGLVRIADGRDAADTAFATIVGPALLRDKTVTVESGPPPRGEDTLAEERPPAAT